jgi:hypothetical protein
MRTILLSILLATTAAVPAYAQPSEREERAQERDDRRSERSKAQKERAEARSERVETRRPGPEATEPVRTERVQRNIEIREQNAVARDQRRAQSAAPSANVNAGGRPTLDERRVNRNAGSAAQLEQRQQIEQRRAQTLEQRQQVEQRRAQSVEQARERMTQARERVRPPAGARPDIPAPPPPVAETTKPVPAPQWSTNHWRKDSRYDWRNHRHRNRSLFRLGFYFDPFGWGYHRWGIGWRLWPSYYDRYYWMNDPWMYRLPYAPWPYRWIRYYNDALLVNVITGQVVDVEYDFFW